MTSCTRFFLLLCLISQGILADFDYSCRDEQGREIGFATTSLFGFPEDPIFSLQDDKAGFNFTVMKGDFRLIEGPEQWHIMGPLNHPIYASYYASFTRVFANSDNVGAQLKFKDARGHEVLTTEFLCQFRWR